MLHYFMTPAAETHKLIANGKHPRRRKGLNILIEDNGPLQSLGDDEPDSPNFRLYSLLQTKKKAREPFVTNLVKLYIPTVGAISYQVLSVHLVHKGFLGRYFGERDLCTANSLLYTAHIGVGLHIYNSPPICFAATYNRLMYSVFGSVLFNFGSLLLWSTLRNITEKFSTTSKVLLALSSATTVLFVGVDYLSFLSTWMKRTLLR